jgi:uncharacterized protein YxjI
MPDHAPAQWLPDPFGRFELRYWDGATWTDHVASGGRQQVDPPVMSPAVAPVRPDSRDTPAGWHPDPSGRHELRYWDGRWTEHVASGGKQAYDMLPGQSVAPTRPAAAAPQAGSPPEVAPPASYPEHVASRTPAPYVEPVPAQPVRASRKVERQVRRVGADRGQAGGGTLLTEDVLVVNQKAKLVGSTLAYDVYDQRGQRLGAFQEVRRDLTTVMSDRMRGRSNTDRTYRFQVVDAQGRVLMAMTRPEQWFTLKSSMAVEGPDGTTIGQIAQETHGLRAAGAATLQAGAGLAAFTALGAVAGLVAAAAVEGVTDRVGLTSQDTAKNGHVRFGLEAAGRRLGSIHAMAFDAWDFRVLDVDGAEVAMITKTWAGWTKERFTKADNYVVQMKQSVEDPLRSLVLAAALAIDVALKQGTQTRGSTLSGTRRYS